MVEDEGCIGVSNIDPVLVEDRGCTSAVEVVSGAWVSEGERFVRNGPPVVTEDENPTAPNE